MSTAVSDVISDALTETGDPQALRTTRAQMLGFYNRIHTRVASETKSLVIDATFDIVANQNLYAYPSDMVVVKGIRYTLSPSDPSTFLWLDEIFSDEYRLATNRLYPSGTVYAYYARETLFELVGKPTAAVVGGAILTYAKIPARVASETGAQMELPDFHRNFIQDGMMILSRMSGRERVAAQQDLKNWEQQLQELRDKMTDRSDDRRPSFRQNTYGSDRYGQT